MAKDKHGKDLRQGDIVVDVHGHVFQLKGAGATFQGHGAVRVAFASELALVHRAGAHSIIWGSDVKLDEAAFDAPVSRGSDGDTIMWGT
jgi:hypothetical protein